MATVRVITGTTGPGSNLYKTVLIADPADLDPADTAAINTWPTYNQYLVTGPTGAGQLGNDIGTVQDGGYSADTSNLPSILIKGYTGPV